MSALGTKAAVRRLIALPCLAALACALAFVSPAPAYAWFNDVTESYPASQPLEISGNIITGAQIPDGTYSITASSSSYMCKLTDVVLTSSGGSLYATFTISKAYNALYLGTAEEAAAQTNEAGNDASAYYVVEPFDGYVDRRFTLPVPALNTEVTLATFNGGTKGLEGGEWYTRTVAFNSSAAVEDAVAGVVDSGKTDEPQDPGTGEDDTRGNPGGAGETPTTPVTPTKPEKPAGKDANATPSPSAGDGKPATTGASSPTAPAATAQGATTETASDTANTAASATDSASPSASTTSAAAKVNAKVGKAVSFVGLDAAAPADLPTGTAGASAAGTDDASHAALIIGIVLVNVALAAVCAFFALRARPGRAANRK